MIEVRSPLEITADPQGGWQLLFCAYDAFNYATPFRTMLAEIVGALTQHAPTDIHLPAYDADEDFIEGTLQLGATSLRIYFEYSLSYLALMSDSKRALQEVAAHIRPHVTVIP